MVFRKILVRFGLVLVFWFLIWKSFRFFRVICFECEIFFWLVFLGVSSLVCRRFLVWVSGVAMLSRR